MQMVFGIMKEWIRRRRRKADNYSSQAETAAVYTAVKEEFSPMTYRNPFIMYIRDVVEQVIKKRHIPGKKLELVIIDAEEGREEDDDDIENVLYELVQQLNYLLLVTDRPDKYEDFMELVYEENGLIVQQMPKTARKAARGNLMLDFERSGGICAEAMGADMIYVPVYKRKWEIGENLDIIVPVGYNTLVVRGIFPENMEAECLTDDKFVMDKKLDRLDREFRKG